jgi:hypothetical protein
VSEPEDLGRLRAGLAARSGVAAGGCPDAERLWQAVSGKLATAERRSLVAHTAECPSCADAWRLARELSPALPARARQSWVRLAWPVAAALVVAGGMVLYTRPTKEPASYRQPAAQAVRSLVPDDASLPRQDCVLRWSGPEGARYDLLVSTEGLRPVVAARDLEASEYRVPEEALAGLPAGTRLLWLVEVKPPGGGTTRSATFIVRIE